jgi:hypothetical protein
VLMGLDVDYTTIFAQTPVETMRRAHRAAANKGM